MLKVLTPVFQIESLYSYHHLSLAFTPGPPRFQQSLNRLCLTIKSNSGGTPTFSQLLTFTRLTWVFTDFMALFISFFGFMSAQLGAFGFHDSEVWQFAFSVPTPKERRTRRRVFQGRIVAFLKVEHVEMERKNCTILYHTVPCLEILARNTKSIQKRKMEGTEEWFNVRTTYETSLSSFRLSIKAWSPVGYALVVVQEISGVSLPKWVAKQAHAGDLCAILRKANQEVPKENGRVVEVIESLCWEELSRFLCHFESGFWMGWTYVSKDLESIANTSGGNKATKKKAHFNCNSMHFARSQIKVTGLIEMAEMHWDWMLTCWHVGRLIHSLGPTSSCSEKV